MHFILLAQQTLWRSCMYSVEYLLCTLELVRLTGSHSRLESVLLHITSPGKSICKVWFECVLLWNHH